MKKDLKEGYGEDAIPLLNNNCIAVLDGLGGAGSTKYSTKKYGENRTGAFISSNETKELLEKYLDLNSTINAADLKNFIKEGLLEFSISNDIKQNTMIRSKMFKLLPTTLSLLKINDNDVDVIWAGDSRVYLYDEDGLHVLSKDDLVNEKDAFENILEDSPMNNNISISSDFFINHLKYAKKTGIYFVASDGVFQYLNSPMQLENFLKESLVKSFSLEEMSLNLMEKLQCFQQDDISFAFMLTDDFLELRSKFINNKSYDLSITSVNDEIEMFKKNLEHYISITSLDKDKKYSEHIKKVLIISNKTIINDIIFEVRNYYNNEISKFVCKDSIIKYNKLLISLFDSIRNFFRETDENNIVKIQLEIFNELKNFINYVNIEKFKIIWKSEYKNKFERYLKECLYETS